MVENNFDEINKLVDLTIYKGYKTYPRPNHLANDSLINFVVTHLSSLVTKRIDRNTQKKIEKLFSEGPKSKKIKLSPSSVDAPKNMTLDSGSETEEDDSAPNLGSQKEKKAEYPESETEEEDFINGPDPGSETEEDDSAPNSGSQKEKKPEFPESETEEEEFINSPDLGQKANKAVITESERKKEPQPLHLSQKDSKLQYEENIKTILQLLDRDFERMKKKIKNKQKTTKL